jgi:LysM repeat protein
MAVNPGINPDNLQIGQVICIPTGTPPPPKCPIGTFAYTIKPGDTVYKLAQTYNTTVAAILAANPGLNPDNLQIGQVICIPMGTPPPPKCPIGTFAYTVKPGDTIYALAMKYNTTVAAIIAANPGIDPNNLQVGQVICIPMGTPPPPLCDGMYYVVRPGDTFYSIANRFGITVAQLIAANPGVDPNNLQVGQLICIPKQTPPVPCPGGTIYVVRVNDSLTSILLRFNISVMDLMAGNPNLCLEDIKVGDELCILPHKDRGCPCLPGSEPYTIVPADVSGPGTVVEHLARKFNVPASSIMLANPSLAPGDFVVGKTVCIPMM